MLALDAGGGLGAKRKAESRLVSETRKNPGAARPSGKGGASGPPRLASPPIDKRVTAEDVRAAYRMFLGRSPESEKAVAAHLAAAPELGKLRERFMESAEFLRAAYQPIVTATIRRAAKFQPNAMEIDVPPAQLERLFAHVQRVWSQLGLDEPHYSVISDRRFRPETLDQNLDAFRRTGQAEVDAVKARLKGLGIDPAKHPDCIEYGCGVGRVTWPLAGLFRRVTGFDISQPHLDLAQQNLRSAGVRNVTLQRVADLRALQLPPHDFFYSRIVLQHNPPPLIAHILRRALSATRRDGIAMFQLVTHLEGYRFETERYLAGAAAINDQELHALRQDAVFAILDELGFRPLLALRDHSVSGLDRISMEFVARRVRGG
jgi:2-polyprenyl-3-methyl-5-hydroxy-6-metoxy-1,4-benzoquinol methylase